MAGKLWLLRPTMSGIGYGERIRPLPVQAVLSERFTHRVLSSFFSVRTGVRTSQRPTEREGGWGQAEKKSGTGGRNSTAKNQSSRGR